MAHPHPMRVEFRHLIGEVRTRHVVPWMLAYAAGAWGLLELISHLAEVYGWPELIREILPMVLGAGILSAAALAWFHGAAGWQRITLRETLVHGSILFVLLGVLLLWGRPTPAPAEAATDPPLTEVAVLYFRDVSGAADDSAVAEVVTEAVIHRLVKVPALDVAPLAAVRPYRSRNETAVDELMAALGVGTYVDGSVQRARDSLRVAGQLVDVRGGGGHLGSWIFTCATADLECQPPLLAVRLADSVRARIGDELQQRRAEQGSSVPAALQTTAERRESSIRPGWNCGTIPELAWRCWTRPIGYWMRRRGWTPRGPRRWRGGWTWQNWRRSWKAGRACGSRRGSGPPWRTRITP